MDKVLVLNYDYTPLNVTTLKRGVNLVLEGKAEILYSIENKPMKTAYKDFSRPSVIRLYRYVNIKYKRVPLNKHNIYRRDNHRCIYCGINRNLTIDHVIPKSKGGDNTWNNMVSCCFECNHKKGDSTPQEKSMTMTHKPFTPTFIDFVETMSGTILEEWKKFLKR